MRLIAALLVFVLGVWLQGPVPPATGNFQQWPRTTEAECDAETKREYALMRKLGWCCDPPITMGMILMSAGIGDDGDSRSFGYSKTPCGRTDSKGEIWPIYELYSNGKTCEVTRQQYDSLYVEKPESFEGRFREFSQERFDILVKTCQAWRP